jgi:hypothetical protein
MEIFLDTADLGAIEELSAILPLSGVTTLGTAVYAPMQGFFAAQSGSPAPLRREKRRISLCPIPLAAAR